MNTIIKDFYDLKVWQEGRKLTRLIYEKTNAFPKSEMFGLSSQMRRASVSVISNIAEGFGRISIKEKLNFYNQSMGSLNELQCQCFVASDLKYLSLADSKEMFMLIRSVQLLLQGFMRSTRKRLIS